MTDRPALMYAPMVRALLREIEAPGSGKTQTRRPAWQAPKVFMRIGDGPAEPIMVPTIWQKVRPGDRIWVRETWMRNPDFADINSTGFVMYRADPGHDHDGPFKPSIHMPRWASRLTLVVTAARMERVQVITADDAMAEGIAIEGFPQPITAFFRLWKSLHPKPPHRLEDNPEIVAVTFVPHLCNVDAMAAVHLTWDEESGAELARVKGT